MGLDRAWLTHLAITDYQAALLVARYKHDLLIDASIELFDREWPPSATVFSSGLKHRLGKHSRNGTLLAVLDGEMADLIEASNHVA